MKIQNLLLGVLLIVFGILSAPSVASIMRLFFPIKTIEPFEYGVFISAIENNSQQDVIFINQLEGQHIIVKSQEYKKIDSWLAASDYYEKGFGFEFRGTITEKSVRSIIVITKKGLFYLNLGRNFNWKGGIDKNTRIWVLNENNDHNKKIEPIKGYPLVGTISAQDDYKRILTITENDDLVIKLNQHSKEKYHCDVEEISSISDFGWYLHKLKGCNHYKIGYPR